MQIVVSLGGDCKLLALSLNCYYRNHHRRHRVHTMLLSKHLGYVSFIKVVNVIPIAKGSPLFSVEKADYNVELQPGNCQH